MLKKWALYAVLLAVPAPALAQPEIRVANATPGATTVLAKSIVRQAVPLDILRSGFVQLLGESVRLNLSASPKVTAREKLYPGYIEAGVKAAVAELERVYPSQIAPWAEQRLVEMYVEQCSPSELADIAHFYETSMGIKLRDALNDPVKQAGLRASLTAEDIAELRRFQVTSGAAKFNMILGQMKPFSSDVLEKFTPALLPELIGIATKKAEEFANSKPNKKS